MNRSRSHKCVFFHVPRTGGSSIRSLGWWDQWTGHFPSASEATGPAKHFSFAFVRNPWDRFVSLYHYFATMTPRHRWYPANRPIVAGIRRFRSFGEFCHEFHAWPHRDNFHFRPQWRWIAEEHGKLLVDFVGRFERLDDDFARICRRLGLSKCRLPRRNSSPHGPYPAYYEKETRRIVGTLYARDADIFGYAPHKENRP